MNTIVADLAEAKKRSGLLHVELVRHLELHVNNQILNYSQLISSQIPRSRAAHAFESLRSAVMFAEFTSITRFWDDDEDSISFPAIVKLIDKVEIQKLLQDDCFDQWTNEPAFAKSEYRKQKARFKQAIELVKTTQGCLLLERVKNLRNKHLAHYTEKTNRDKKREKDKINPIPNAKLGDEKALLNISLRIANLLYLALNGTDYRFPETKKIFKKRADAFWKGVTVEVLQ